MARSSRQSKILELISTKEIETQDELVSQLRNANYDITQATISRDIKELGLIKILSSETGRYKYAIVQSEQSVSNKYINIFKEAVISVNAIDSHCIIKTIKGLGPCICNLMDKFNVQNMLGCVSGDDTVMIIFNSFKHAEISASTLLQIME